jgi:SAM-dependent methyltransferase
MGAMAEAAKSSAPPPRNPPGGDRAGFYESHQEWPAAVGDAIARHLRASAGRAPLRSIFLGCATGVNDALPFARLSAPGERVVASDLDPAFLERLRGRALAERLAHVEVRKLDILTDLEGAGSFDVAAMFFVIHRVPGWEKALPGLVGRVAPGGSFYTSEFAGPSGVIYLSNEGGGRAGDPVSRLIRRYFELLPQRFDPPLKSTRIGPFLEALSADLAPAGFRDFSWPQSLTVADMYAKIESGAYAPYLTVLPPRPVLDRLREEFAAEWTERSNLVETIRIYQLRRA